MGLLVVTLIPNSINFKKKQHHAELWDRPALGCGTITNVHVVPHSMKTRVYFSPVTPTIR